MRYLLAFLFISHTLFADAIPSYSEAMNKGYSSSKCPMGSTFERLYQKNHFLAHPDRTEYKIPKIIHQIWLGSPLPEQYESFVQSWIDLHPEWEHKIWNDEDAASYTFIDDRLREAFERETNWAVKADIWRLDILFQIGGIYADPDFLAIRPLDPVAKNCSFFAGLVRDDFLNNAIIGSAPNHPFILYCLESLTTLTGIHTNPAIVSMTTGPQFLSTKIQEFMKNSKDPAVEEMVIYPTKYFYPIPHHKGRRLINRELNWSRINPYISEETLAIHFWAKSWMKKKGDRSRKDR